MVKILNYILVFAAGAALAGWFVHRGAESVQGPEVAVTEARAPLDAVASPAPPDARLAAEVARLTRENAEMRSALGEAQTQLADSDAVLRNTEAKLDELRRPMTEDILSSSLRAEMKSGEAIVTGGYRLPDGKRLYAFATPVLETVDGADSVRIEGRYVAVNDAAGAAAGLEGLATNAANTLQHGEVWIAEEERAVVEQLSVAEGTAVFNYPGVSVRPGFTASIEVAGIRLKVTPELAGAEGALNVELRLEQPAVASEREMPAETVTSPPEPVSQEGL